jgi:hypothetical protein
MPPKKKDKLANWGKEQRKELTKQWNLFVESDGENGWDPRLNTTTHKTAIVELVKTNDVLRPYLSVQDGGHSSNKDNTKFFRNFRKQQSDYFADEYRTGKRKASDESDVDSDEEDDEEDSLDDEEEEEEEESATMPPKKKTPSKQKKAAPKTPSKDDADDDLSNAMNKQLDLNSWFVNINEPNCSYTANVFVQPETGTRYVHFTMECLTSLASDKVVPKILNEGDKSYLVVEVTVVKGGTTANPEYLAIFYGDDIRSHPMYVNRRQVRRFVSRSELKTIKQELPFCCDPSGFYDPITGNQKTIELCAVPVVGEVDKVEGVDVPYTLMLNLCCEELLKEEVEQKTTTKSFMAAARASRQQQEEKQEDMDDDI